MASKTEVTAMMNVMKSVGVDVIENEAVNHHFLHSFDHGALQVRNVSGSVRTHSGLGELQVEYAISIAQVDNVPFAVVSGNILAWPMNDDLAAKDIFDDAWTLLGREIEIGDHGFGWIIAKLVYGVVHNVNEYALNGDSTLTDFTSFS